MNKIVKPILVLGLIALLFPACEKTEQIDDFPIVTPGLVLNNIFQAEDSLKFKISRSLSVLDNAELSNVPDAKLSVFEDGVLVDQIDSANQYGIFESKIVPEQGKSYRAKVDHPKYKSIETSLEKLPLGPGSVEIASFRITDSISGYGWEEQSFIDIKAKVDLRLKDSGEESSYYAVRAFVVDSVNYETGENFGDHEFVTDLVYTLKSSDPALEEIDASMNDYGTDILFFNDDVFNGKEYDFKFSLQAYNFQPTAYLKIELYTMSETAYKYYKSARIYYDSNGDPFSEPVRPFTNIKNGYGIFAGIHKEAIYCRLLD